MPNFNRLRVLDSQAVFPECVAYNLDEGAHLELLGEDVVEHEDGLALGFAGDPLQEEVQFFLDLHIRHVNIPLDLFQAF